MGLIKRCLLGVFGVHKPIFFLWFCCVFFSCRGNRVDTALVSRHKELQREVCDLTDAEEQLDELISKCNLQLRLLTEEPQNKKYPFGGTFASCSPTHAQQRCSEWINGRLKDGWSDDIWLSHRPCGCVPLLVKKRTETSHTSRSVSTSVGTVWHWWYLFESILWISIAVVSC